MKGRPLLGDLNVQGYDSDMVGNGYPHVSNDEMTSYCAEFSMLNNRGFNARVNDRVSWGVAVDPRDEAQVKKKSLVLQTPEKKPSET